MCGGAPGHGNTPAPGATLRPVARKAVETWPRRNRLPERANGQLELRSYDRPVADRLPRVLLRAEGAAVAVAAIALYFHAGYPWWLFLVLILAPDLSMLGYVAGPTIGAATYDAVHTSVLPVALAAIGVIADAELAVQVGLIWLAHIGIDRAIGYGLKYPTGFKDTHLQRV